MNDYDAINQKLEVVYDLLVDNFGTLESEIIDLIANPDKIANTNKFASLLHNLQSPVYISPLLYQINRGKKGDRWLCDFLYAAIKLLEDCSIDDEFDTQKDLVDKLGVWVLENTRELAWKAASLVKFSDSNQAEEIGTGRGFLFNLRRVYIRASEI